MRRVVMGVTAAVLSLAAVEQAAAGPSFVAEAIQRHPQQGVREGRMYVSDRGVRMEQTRQGEKVVQISLPDQGIMRILFPQSRTYMQMEMPATAGGMGSRPDDPCIGVPDSACRRQGTEKLGDMQAEKWRIDPPTRDGQEPQGPVFVWWNPERRLALRQEFPDGTVTQMSFQGTAEYEGRTVERWEMVKYGADGSQSRASQLYDPELELAVREEFPGGLVRELRNIRLVEPKDSWFAVPDGYREQQPQQRRQTPRGQQGGRSGYGR